MRSLGIWSGAFCTGAQIYKDSGTLELFQNHSATLLRTFPYAAIKLLAYSEVCNVCPTAFALPFLLSRYSGMLMPTHDQKYT
jgi:hypothetical protein